MVHARADSFQISVRRQLGPISLHRTVFDRLASQGVDFGPLQQDCFPGGWLWPTCGAATQPLLGNLVHLVSHVKAIDPDQYKPLRVFCTCIAASPGEKGRAQGCRFALDGMGGSSSAWRIIRPSAMTTWRTEGIDRSLTFRLSRREMHTLIQDGLLTLRLQNAQVRFTKVNHTLREAGMKVSWGILRHAVNRNWYKFLQLGEYLGKEDWYAEYEVFNSEIRVADPSWIWNTMTVRESTEEEGLEYVTQRFLSNTAPSRLLNISANPINLHDSALKIPDFQ